MAVFVYRYLPIRILRVVQCCIFFKVRRIEKKKKKQKQVNRSILVGRVSFRSWSVGFRSHVHCHHADCVTVTLLRNEAFDI